MAMMTRTFFRRLELEPPPWIYAHMARTPLFRRIYWRIVAEVAFGTPAGARLLDVGTGPGYLLRYLARERPDLKLYGLDFSFRMIAQGRRRLGDLQAGAALVGDSRALPVRTACLDRILATFSFHIWQDPIQAAKEMVRVLKPDGRAWIYEMNREASRRQLQAFAREECLPFLLVLLGFRSLAWNHALRAADFATVFEQAGLSSWSLTPVHHLFWRVEILKEPAPV